jgi:hypothetical protein
MQFSKQAFWIVLPIVVQLVCKAKCNDTLIDEISWGSGHETAKGLATQGNQDTGSRNGRLRCTYIDQGAPTNFEQKRASTRWTRYTRDIPEPPILQQIDGFFLLATTRHGEAVGVRVQLVIVRQHVLAEKWGEHFPFRASFRVYKCQRVQNYIRVAGHIVLVTCGICRQHYGGISFLP